jgi:hypothetical protein
LISYNSKYKSSHDCKVWFPVGDSTSRLGFIGWWNYLLLAPEIVSGRVSFGGPGDGYCLYIRPA